MNTMKFAVTRIVGNEKTIIRTFPEEEKQNAIEYGREIAKGNISGVIACIKALFDENDNRADNKCWIFEVWE